MYSTQQTTQRQWI